jgi:glycosyltransferase involved in cell wall biosynthesis
MSSVFSKISVIMSIYSEPKEWMIQSIDSILNQTYRNFEFIIINDNPDRLLNDEILKSYQIKDSRISIVKNEKNLGLTKSLNEGLKLAKGKYIARMDADDIALPLRFEKQISFLEKNKDYVACGTKSKMIDERGVKLENILVPITNIEITNRVIVKNPMTHPTFMIRNDILKKNKLLYDESLRFAQDYQLVVDLIFLGKLYNLPEILLLYRKSVKQISSINLKRQDFYANKIRERFILKSLSINNVSLKTLTPFFDKTDILLEEIKNKEISNIPLLKNINVSLVLNSEIKIDTIKILRIIFLDKISLKNRLRLIIHLLR